MPVPAGGSGVRPVSLDDLKRQLNRPLTDTTDDEELLTYLDAAIGVVEDLVGPLTVQTFTEQRVANAGVVALNKLPLVSVTSVTGPSGTPLDAGLYTADTSAGLVRIGYGGSQTYDVVYEAGHDAAPPAYRLAVLIIAQHLWRTQHGGGGRVMPGEDAVSMPGMSFAIPARAVELLTGGMLPGIA